MLFMFIKIIFKKFESINCEKVVNNIYMSMQTESQNHFFFSAQTELRIIICQLAKLNALIWSFS